MTSTPAAPTRRSRPWLRRIVLLALAAAVIWALTDLAGRVDADAVLEALGQLAWWQAPILVGLLLLRQLLTSAPIARFTAGLGQLRALHNELAANLVATVTPPPADIVLRIAMFRSWGLDPVSGMAGVTLATVVFWGARFLAPVMGLAFLAWRGIERHEWWVAGACLVVAAAILGALGLMLRDARWAAWLGAAAARTVARFGRRADAEGWAEAVVSFRARVAATLREHLVAALTLMLTGVLVEALLLLASLRFVGVPSSLSSIEILGVFLLAYPLTILPFLGLGVLDAALVSLWLTDDSPAPEATLVAGMLVWRAVSLGGTLLIGAASVAWWRWTVRRAQAGS
ncbi:lysylphosphatidylglycerol synthase domain-containing protein [Demequina lignilytica]|uniref:Lysylphosphatidylglycerol synthase domain-containing protein n=1 Tax=Demequina lignilytica TaxID=3051663 RepID=A0AB35MEW5_9MICO|nr:lysylphosphatidylglycerol synthase domain-containing protein [Demequina sp. SYSU T0a273]MDN4482306.1 lysylphosphatidylglycerol synthase domain-containing protein [Demequina sp. SYSU T0a273]